MPIKREYGVTPFWFWNDQLCEEEILRQITSMDHVGVGGFVLHPRVGLPRDQGWMSDSLLGYMRIACAEAKRRGLRVILYDEGMYPSGSSSGQVVAENPAYQTRCIQARPGAGIEPGENLLWQQRAADGSTLSYVDAPLPSVIRGLHYRDEASASEETPPAADLLNPEAMQCFLRLVHDRYYAKLGEWFGDTITGIFTDEPSLLGRAQVQNVLPGTSGLLAHVYRLTGVDFTPLLPALFDATHPEHERLKATWWKACRLRLEETYYAPMSDWCHRHGLELMGHPELPTDLALQRFLSVPGQDCVWRWNVPGPTATQGAQSTNPKCASSAAAHLGRPRNSNEFCGAYGHELTFEEMKWLADYLLVRGQNWLMPHAYYYSIRGPRRDERPPDVGFNSKWPDRLAQFNAYCEQLSQRIAQSRQVVHVAVLGTGDELPWAAAETLFNQQIDFNYLEDDQITSGAAQVSPNGIDLAGFHYDALIHDGVGQIGNWVSTLGPRFIAATQPDDWLARLLAIVPRTLMTEPAGIPGLRVRRMQAGSEELVFVFNESVNPLSFHIRGPAKAVDPWTGQTLVTAPLQLPPFATALLT